MAYRMSLRHFLINLECLQLSTENQVWLLELYRCNSTEPGWLRSSLACTHESWVRGVGPTKGKQDHLAITNMN